MGSTQYSNKPTFLEESKGPVNPKVEYKQADEEKKNVKKAEAKESKINKSKEVAEVKEDRSAYNCPTCKGEGLEGEARCSKCSGTGKV